MLRPLFALALCLLSLPVWADIPRPTSVEQTLALMLERLTPDFPDAAINWSDRNIALDAEGTLILNPDNIHAVLQTIDDGAAREAELEGFLATVTASIDDDPFDDGLPLDRVFPVVRHQSLATFEGSEDLFVERAIGDLIVTYVIDYPDRVAYLTRTAMADAGVTEQVLATEATRNMALKQSHTEFRGGNGIYMAVIDGFYESSLLLDEALWADLAAQLGDDLIIAVPNRDILLLTTASDTAAVTFLDEIRAESLATGSHPLSEFSYFWRNGALSLRGQ